MKVRPWRAGALLAPLIASLGAAADPPSAEPPGAGSAAQPAKPPVGLDTLLRLPPGGTPTDQPRAGGASKPEWQERFATARGDVAAAQKAIDDAQQEIGKLAEGSDSWSVSAPGAPAGTENSPLSYRLRQELRKQRDELAAAERRLTELEVEANLAGIPESWTVPDEAAKPTPAPAPAR